MFNDFKQRFRRWRDRWRFILARCCLDRQLPVQQGKIAADSLLFIRTDAKLGDSVVSSFVFRELKKAQPGIRLGVLLAPALESLYQRNPHIDACHCLKKRAGFAEIRRVCRSLPHYQVVVFLGKSLRPRDLYLLRFLDAKTVIGRVSGVGLINAVLPNASTDAQEICHESELFAAVLRQLGVSEFDSQYELHIPDECQLRVEQFCRQLSRPVIALNPYGNSHHRCFRPERIAEVLNALAERFADYALVLLTPPVHFRESARIVDDLGYGHVTLLPEGSTLEEMMALVKQSQLLISVDTATVHIATAALTPTVAIYRQDEANYRQWHPNSPVAATLFCRQPVTPLEEVNIGEFDLEKLIELCDLQLNKGRQNG